MPFAHENAQLEEKFVVVHWDHRGAGKSFRLFGRKPALGIDVMVEDIRKVVEWLRQTLQIEKVYLVAHSWGTVPAILAASRYPDLFCPYIGVAQIADLMLSERQRYQYAFTKALEQGNREALADLRRIRLPESVSFGSRIQAIGRNSNRQRNTETRFSQYCWPP